MLKIEDYANLFDHIKLSSEEIENQIKDYSLTFSKIKNNDVEWRMRFPIFLNSFYKSIYETNVLPNQTQFWDKYLLDNISFFYEKKYSEEIMSALKARAYRTYPSLVRDIHFVHYVKENLIDSKVVYNRKLDVEEGIDMLIVKDDSYFGINLFTATDRSFESRDKKDNRHRKYDNIKYILLPVNFKGSYTCGDFFLYKENELKTLLNVLNSDVF